MHRCDIIHGEGKLYSGNNNPMADIDPDIYIYIYINISTTNGILANQSKY